MIWVAIPIAAISSALALVAVRKRKGGAAPSPKDDDEHEEHEEHDIPPGGSMFQNNDKVLAVGEANDPNVLPLLTEIRELWRSKGVDLSAIDPTQFYVMSKATPKDGPDPDEKPGPILAIASRATWDRTATFIANVVQPIMQDLARRGVQRSQYRFGGFREGYGSDGKGKGSYNTVVGGAKASRHVDGDAVDIIPTGGTGTGHKILLAIARFKVDHPNDEIGFGAYSNRGHVDIGGDRTWDGDSVPGNAEKYLKLARQEKAVA